MLPQQYTQREESIFKSMVTPLPEMKSCLKVELALNVENAWAIGKIFKTLENENLIIEDFYFAQSEYLWLTIRKVNGVYQLAQCAAPKVASFLRSSKLTYPSSAEEVESQLASINRFKPLAQIPMVSESQLPADSEKMTVGQYQEFGLILITGSALHQSGRSKSAMTHIFELFANKKFSILRCQTFHLKEAAAHQISNFPFVPLDGSTKVRIVAGKCICLLFQGVMACISIGQILKSNQTIQRMSESIFTPQNEVDALQISSSLFGFNHENHIK